MKAKDKVKQARDVAYWSEAAFISFTEDLLKMMGDRITQAELARRVGVSRGYISRVFRGVENLTLETMTKLAIAVGGSVRLHVAPQDQVTRWNDVPTLANVVADGSLEIETESNRSAATALAKPRGSGASPQRAKTRRKAATSTTARSPNLPVEQHEDTRAETSEPLRALLATASTKGRQHK